MTGDSLYFPSGYVSAGATEEKLLRPIVNPETQPSHSVRGVGAGFPMLSGHLVEGKIIYGELSYIAAVDAASKNSPMPIQAPPLPRPGDSTDGHRVPV